MSLFGLSEPMSQVVACLLSANVHNQHQQSLLSLVRYCRQARTVAVMILWS